MWHKELTTNRNRYDNNISEVEMIKFTVEILKKKRQTTLTSLYSFDPYFQFNEMVQGTKNELHKKRLYP